MATERLQVILDLVAGRYKSEARQAAQATGRISQEAKKASTETSGLQSRMVGFGSVLRGAAVTGAFVAVSRGIGNAISAAEEAASIMAITEQVIKQTGGAANVTADDVANLSSQFSKLTGIEDELVQEGANVLLTFKNIRNEAGEGNAVFDRTAALMLDISAVMGTDAKSAALQLGKALNDPVSQMGALSRAGLTFSQAQKDQIKSLVANNDLLSAQKLILGELETQLGGTAAASADVSDKIGIVFGELQEQVGTKLLPLLETLNSELTRMGGDQLGALAMQTGQAKDSAALLFGSLLRVSNEMAKINREGRGRSGLDEFREQAEGLIDAAGTTDSELRKLRDGLPGLMEQFGLTAGEGAVLEALIAEELAPTTAEFAAHAASLEGELDALHGTTKEWAGEVERAVPSQEALAFQTERAAKAAKFQRDEIRRTQDVLRGIHQPMFRVVSLNADLAEAQDAVTEASKKGLTSPEYRDAIIDRANIIADLKATMLDLKEDAVDPTSAAVRLMFSDLEVPQEIIDGLFADFDAIEANLKGRAWSVPIEFIPNRPTVGSGTLTQRHSGGPVMANQAYRIRPDEEIFIPSGNGQMVLNDQILSALSGMGSGSTVNNHGGTQNITLQSTGDTARDAQVVSLMLANRALVRGGLRGGAF